MQGKGLELFPYTLALHVWALHWLPLKGGAELKLTHSACNHVLQTTLRCAHCGVALQAKDVTTAKGSKP